MKRSILGGAGGMTALAVVVLVIGWPHGREKGSAKD